MSRARQALDAMRHRNALRLAIREFRLMGDAVAEVEFLREELETEEQADREILKRAQYRRNSGNRTAGRW